MMPPARIRRIALTDLESSSPITMIIKVTTNTRTGIFFRSSVFIMLIPVVRIRKATAHLMPTKAYATYLFAMKASKNREMTNIIINNIKKDEKCFNLY